MGEGGVRWMFFLFLEVDGRVLENFVYICGRFAGFCFTCDGNGDVA